MLFAYLLTETGSSSVKTEKRMMPKSSSLDRTRLANKGFFIWKKHFFLGTQQVIPPKQAKNDAKYCLHDGILKFGLLIKHEVKLAEYLLIFVCVYGQR